MKPIADTLKHTGESFFIDDATGKLAELMKHLRENDKSSNQKLIAHHTHQ